MRKKINRQEKSNKQETGSEYPYAKLSENDRREKVDRGKIEETDGGGSEWTLPVPACQAE